MFKGDMNKKTRQSVTESERSITLHGGQTILSTGITGDDARLAKAVCEAGVKLLERTTLRWRWRVDTKA